MSGDSLDVAWDTFMDEHGNGIQQWVLSEMEQTREIFDFKDGTHIKWVDGDNIGFLITLSAEEVCDMLTAWEDAHLGSPQASDWLLARCAKAFAMLEVAMGFDEDETE